MGSLGLNNNKAIIFGKRHWAFLLLLALAYTLYCHILLDLSTYDFSDDEFQMVSHGISLLETGKYAEVSIDNLFFPGLPRGVVYVTLVTASMFIFGVNEVAARFPSLFIGALCVLSSYLIVYRFTSRRIIAFLTALLLTLTPLFVTWQFGCRFYTSIVFFHILTLLFFYLGIESNGISSKTVKPQEPDSNCSRIPGACIWFKQYLRREGINPLFLFLFVAVFWINLNQNAALGVVPFGLTFYGLIMFFINCGAFLLRDMKICPLFISESRLARRFFLKYFLLGLMFIFLIIGMYSGLKNIHFLHDNISMLRKLPACAQRYMDLGFSQFSSQKNSELFQAFFPGRYVYALVPLLILGAAGFLKFAKHHKSYGCFLILNYIPMLFMVSCGWKLPQVRYGIFMLAMHVPLIGSGIYMFAHIIEKLLMRLFTHGPEKLYRYISYATIILVLASLYLPDIVSGEFSQRAYKAPFVMIEYKQAYDYLYKHVATGDAIGAQYNRKFYQDMMRKKNGVSPSDYTEFSLRKQRSFKMSELLDQMKKHPKGWIMWAENKKWHIKKPLCQLCEGRLTKHNATEKGTISIYSWSKEQAQEIIKLANNIPKIHFVVALTELNLEKRSNVFWQQALDYLPHEGVALSFYTNEKTPLGIVNAALHGPMTQEIANDLIKKFSPEPDKGKVNHLSFAMDGKPVNIIYQYSTKK